MKLKFLNNVVTIFVIAILACLIIPLNTGVLDFMFILNLAISLVILLTTMYIREPQDLSIFPALLLITTLFRLSLNVSSTRSILTNQGYAGEVIKTFGQFVIRGNIVVGLVIFLIIVLVQFIVITKGAERVAEVSARFTLDAMPGKQMAIDADLSSGLIDEQQARQRREKISREADFFGSMDGASKFVKGDAIISIIITLINLIGGIVVGMINGEGDFATIAQIYCTSTVGDGLMSQIPALLISVATGMIVTRSASEADLSTDVIRQFSRQPTVLIIAGCTMPLLCLIGFPVVQILLVSALLLGMGLTVRNRDRQKALAPVEQPLVKEEITSEVSYYKNLDNVYGLLNVDPVGVEVGYSLLPLVDESSGGNFLDRIVMLRKQFADEMGMVIPSIRLKDSAQLNPNQYEFKLRGESVAAGEVLVDHYLGLVPSSLPPDKDTIQGIETTEPAFGMPAKWISEDQKMNAEMLGYTLIDPTSVMITHLSEVIRRHASELLNRQEVKKMLENLKKTNPSIVEDTVPGVVSLNELHTVLRNLLREGIPILDMESILETLADYAPSVKDRDMLTEYVRQGLKRTITHRFSEMGQMKVISLDSSVEDVIIKSVKKIEGGSYLALDPSTIQRIVENSTKQLNKMKKAVSETIVLTSPIVRIYYKHLIDQFYPNVTVLSYNDLDSTVQIQSLETITLGEA